MKPLPARFSWKARLALTDLEDRVTPATFMVLNTDDSGAGSLRQAITDANTTVGDDNIVFDASFSSSTNTIFIDSALPTTSGTAGNNLTLEGPGAHKLTISPSVSGIKFVVVGGGGNTVEFRDMTITGFNNSLAGGVISNSSSGSLTLNRVNLSGNSTTSTGGTLYLTAGTHSIIDSTLSGNSSGSNTGGGAIRLFSSSNSLTVTNSTITGNVGVNGGGISLSSSFVGTLTLNNSTITNNTALAATVATDGEGAGGIGRHQASTTQVVTIDINNSIVANNFALNGRSDMALTLPTTGSLTINATNSIIGNADSITLATNTNSVIGTTATPVDARVSVLGSYGGTVPTVIPSIASPAVDLYDTGSGNDQRGFARPALDADAGSTERQASEVAFVSPANFAPVTFDDITTNPYVFTVNYYGIDAATLGSNDVRVTGPSGFNVLATFNGPAVAIPGGFAATYQFTPPNGAWTNAGGVYTASLEAGAVLDSLAVPVAASKIGTILAFFSNNYVVTNPGDNGGFNPAPGANTGTLRQAIVDANTFPLTADSITFSSTFNTAQTIDLLAALPVIADALTITGPGSSKLTLQRDAAETKAFTILAIADASAVNVPMFVSGIRIVGNSLSAITTSNEDVSLTDLHISGVSGAASGGGISVSSTGILTLTNSTITNNTVTGAGGGINFAGSGNQIIVNSSISDNSANGLGGGIALGTGGVLTITGSTIANNTSTSSGGGLSAGSTTAVSIDTTTVDGNTAIASGGGIGFTSTSSVVSSLILTNSAVTNNRSFSSTVVAGGGGLLFAGTSGSTALIRNTTISGNKAQASGGGVLLARVGGNVTFQNSTITDNYSFTPGTTSGVTAAGGGGIAFNFVTATTQPTLSLVSTILSGNSATNGRNDLVTAAPASPALVTLNVDYSAIGDTNDFTINGSNGNNLSAANSSIDMLQLGALTNGSNGTRAHVLGAGSTAIGTGSNPSDITPMLTTDQRGIAREAIGNDIGATERVDLMPIATPSTFTNVVTATPTQDTFTVTYTDPSAINYLTIGSTDVTVTRVSDGLALPTTLVGISPSGTNGTSLVATYQFAPAGGSWDVGDNGRYTVDLAGNEVKNAAGTQSVPAGLLGSFQVALPVNYVVTNTDNSGAGSLREAVILANRDPFFDTITFSDGSGGTTDFTTPQTIILTSSTTTSATTNNIIIGENVSIIGPGAKLLTITSLAVTNPTAVNGDSRAFFPQNASYRIDVSMSGFTLTGFNCTGNAGGIAFNGENLTLTDMVISNNTSGGSNGGGGVYSSSAGNTLTVIRSEISNNIATAGASGGIYMEAGTLGATILVIDSTISGNSAAGSGGGFTWASGNAANCIATFINSTIANNTASNGGGLRTSGSNASITLISTIVSGNLATGGIGHDINFAKVNSINSAIGDGANFTTGSSVNDLPIGIPLGLLPLADNGGDMRTHAFDATSPLKHRGLNTLGLTTDARGAGFPREIATGLPDIGSYEFQPVDPEAAATFDNIDKTNAATSNPYFFTVNYMAGSAIDLVSLDNSDVLVTGPNGYNKLATFVSSSPAPFSTSVAAVYKVSPPDTVNGWAFTDNGTYTVTVQGGQVSTASNGVPNTIVGTFNVGTSATFTVTNTNDSGPGSLRAAIDLANSNPSFDDIVFDSSFNTPQTITLSTGELLISESVSLIGSAGRVTISGNNASRVLNVDGPGNITVNISNINIVNGASTGTAGGLRNDNERVTLTDSSVDGNTAAGNGGGIGLVSIGGTLTLVRSTVANNFSGAIGGGIDLGSSTGSVTLIDSTLAANSASGIGGGLAQIGGSLTLLRSTVTGNLTGNHGGGMYLNNATLIADNSTWSGNIATAAGGAISFANLNIAPVIRNSTLTLNTAGTTGGGLNRISGTAVMSVLSTIVAGNTSATGGPDINLVTGGSLDVGNSLIGVADNGNLTLTGTGFITGTLAMPSNPMLGVLSNNGGFTQTHLLSAGSPAIDAGSNLATLTTDQRNQPRENPAGKADIGAFERIQGAPSAQGGPFLTIDGNNAAAQNPYFFTVTYANESNINVLSLGNDDIRVTGPGGFNAFATFVSSGANALSVVATYKLAAPVGGWNFTHSGVYTIASEAGKVASIGAVTNPAATVGSFTVDIGAVYAVVNTNDSGVGSLRQAVLDANASPARDTIIFSSLFSTPQTISLKTGEITITDSLVITGPGNPNLVTLSGGGGTRHFNILSIPRTIDVSMSGMTLTEGAVSGIFGGSIQFNNEKLTLTEMVLTGNSSLSGGGALAADLAGSSLTIIRSALTNNLTNADGAAMRINNVIVPGSVVIRESTISGNSAGAYAGVMRHTTSSTGTVMIFNSTITNNTGNQAAGGGGFVASNTATVYTVVSSIVSGNFSPNVPAAADWLNGAVNSSFSALGALSPTVAQNSVNDLPLGSFLGLLPLADNGGYIPTHAFVSGSPVIDAGSNPNGDTFDGRGVGFSRELPAGKADIGSYERNPVVPDAVAGPLPTVIFDDFSTNPYMFTVTYSDDVAIDFASIGTGDILVTGPGGFSQIAQFVNIDAPIDGTPRTATYQITPTGNTWDAADNGVYTVALQANQVKSTQPTFVPAQTLGTFNVGFNTTYTVTNANDSGPGSFRQALLNSNLSVNTPDTIVFDTGFFNTSMKTIALLSPLPGIADAVTITGPGANLATVSGEGHLRLLDTTAAPFASIIVISGLTLANGVTGGNGGALNIGDEALTLTDMVLTNSRAYEGGGISMNGAGASLVVTDSTISNNVATIGDGGGINVGAANLDVTISTTTLSGNTAGSDGGAIYFVNGGSLVMNRSTVSGNVATGIGGINIGGGGIYFFGTIGFNGFRISNSTISGNTHTTRPGGGLAFNSVAGTAYLLNSTVVGNNATIGGGIARINGTNSLVIISSVVSGNTDTSGTAPDISFGTAAVTVLNSAVGTDPLGSLSDYGNPGAFNIPFGTPLLLGPLQNNGGPTRTHLPASNSPLVDAGSNLFPLIPDVDQNGNPRTNGAFTDIGAVEQFALPTVTGFTINGGNGQRSRITTMTINFTGNVSPGLFSAAGAITLTRIASPGGFGPLGTVIQTGATGPNGLITLSQGTATSLVLTFSNANGSDTTDAVEHGALPDGTGSLTDGRWQLAIAGVNFLSDPNTQPIRRLFGDFDGSGNIDGSTDFAQFGSVFGLSSISPSFLSLFDFDQNGSIDGSTDFAQFGQRFGRTV